MEPARCGCIRPGAPAISCAYPVTAGAASRTVSPGLACAAIISVLEQSGALRGETPLPSLGFPRAAPAVWISLLRSQSRVQAFCLPPGGCFGRPGALRGRQARTGRAGGVSPRGSHLPVAPRRSLPGYLPASLSEARTGVLPPSRWVLDVREVCGAVRPAQAARRGVSPRALPCPWRRAGPFLTACWVPPGISRFCSQSRVHAFCLPPGGFRTSGSPAGPSGPHRGAQGVRFPGGSPLAVKTSSP